VGVGVADTEADALADGFAFFLAGDGDGVGGGENVEYS
jgi:hypothetical protein